MDQLFPRPVGFGFLMWLAFAVAFVVPPPITRRILTQMLKVTTTVGVLFCVSALEIFACLLSLAVVEILKKAMETFYKARPDLALAVPHGTFHALFLLMWWLTNVGLNLVLIRSLQRISGPAESSRRRLLVSLVLGLLPLAPVLVPFLIVSMLAS